MKIITIDGPSASGKGTVANLVAEKLNFAYLDSGALYRLVAYNTHLNKINYKNQEYFNDIAKIALNLNVEFKENSIYLDNVDVSKNIRQEEIGMIASAISQIPEVRQNLLEFQQKYGEKSGKKGLVADGRDMGSVVFPKADLKVFLTASSEIRSKRRDLQLNHKIAYEQILAYIEKRDFQDQNRAIAPLKCYDDMKLLDTSNLSIEEAVNQILNWLS